MNRFALFLTAGMLPVMPLGVDASEPAPSKVRELDIGKMVSVSYRSEGSPMKPTRFTNSKELVKALTGPISNEIARLSEELKSPDLSRSQSGRMWNRREKLKENLAEITKPDFFKGKIDFAKEDVIYFAWAGSGQDRIAPASREGAKKGGAAFLYQQGMTEDLRPHCKIYAVGKGSSARVAKSPLRIFSEPRAGGPARTDSLLTEPGR